MSFEVASRRRDATDATEELEEEEGQGMTRREENLLREGRRREERRMPDTRRSKGQTKERQREGEEEEERSRKREEERSRRFGARDAAHQKGEISHQIEVGTGKCPAKGTLRCLQRMSTTLGGRVGALHGPTKDGLRH